MMRSTSLAHLSLLTEWSLQYLVSTSNTAVKSSRQLSFSSSVSIATGIFFFSYSSLSGLKLVANLFFVYHISSFAAILLFYKCSFFICFACFRFFPPPFFVSFIPSVYPFPSLYFIILLTFIFVVT
jgi:hypothetical protein